MRIVISFLAFFCPALVQAASPIGNVGTAVVDAGAASVEMRSGYGWDDTTASQDQRFRLRQHVDYGFNDWYAVRLITTQDKRQGDNIEYTGVSFENRIQLIECRDYGWDGGIRLIYTQADGAYTPNVLDFRFMAQVPFGDGWEFRHNIVLKHDIGENMRHGLRVELRHQLAHDITQWVAPPEYLGVKKLA